MAVVKGGCRERGLQWREPGRASGQRQLVGLLWGYPFISEAHHCP